MYIQMPSFIMAAAGFDWDSGNRDKCLKHGVSMEEIESLFARPHAIMVDTAHSAGEERLRAIGKTAAGRYVFSRLYHQGTRRRSIHQADQRALHAQEGN